MDITVVLELLGRSTTTTTPIYRHLIRGDLQAGAGGEPDLRDGDHRAEGPVDDDGGSLHPRAPRADGRSMDFVTVEALVRQAARTFVRDESPLGRRDLAAVPARELVRLLPDGWSVADGAPDLPDRPAAPEVLLHWEDAAGGGLLAVLVRAGAGQADQAWRTLTTLVGDRGYAHAVVLSVGLDLARGVQPTWQWAASGAAAADVRPARVFSEAELRGLVVDVRARAVLRA